MRFSNLRKVSFGDRVKLECLRGEKKLEICDMLKQLSECTYFEIEKKKIGDLILILMYLEEGHIIKKLNFGLG